MASLSPSLPATNAKRLRKGAKRRSNPWLSKRRNGLLRCSRNDGLDTYPYFFTLLASIFTFVSSILTENAVFTSNGFSMPR
jgi:hypothetical protein